jgi:hypothetical protein
VAFITIAEVEGDGIFEDAISADIVDAEHTHDAAASGTPAVGDKLVEELAIDVEDLLAEGDWVSPLWREKKARKSDAMGWKRLLD